MCDKIADIIFETQDKLNKKWKNIYHF
jgi:hypothetical protein